MNEQEMMEQEANEQPEEQAEEERSEERNHLEELEALRQALDEERAQLQAEREAFQQQCRMDRVSRELEHRGMNGGFARYLLRESDEESMAEVEAFENLFRESLTRAVIERMRGGFPPRVPEKAAGYRRDDLGSLSRREINAHWEEVMQSLRE